MSNIRDLFAGGGTSQLGFSLRREPISEYFVIDGESRTITAPSDFHNFGVESDEKTERVWFECPQIVGDGIDLTTMNLYVNYRNANGEKDSYSVTDVEADGENIHFSWVLSRKCTQYKGAVNFIVCAKKTDSNGEIVNEWNTTLCSGNVLEGLDVENPATDESTSDLVDQLVNLVNAVAEDVEKLTDFFKVLPEGMTIDDLEGEEFTGCYILFDPEFRGHTGHLYVSWGAYSDNAAQKDIPCTYQTRCIQNSDNFRSDHTFKIETRNNAYGWSDWEDVFPTKDYVDSEIAKIPTGGESELELLGTATLEEETTSMQISTDLNGNAFEVGGQAVLGRQIKSSTPWLTERHGYDPT